MQINGGTAKIIYGDLCYKLYGIFYAVHNELGRYCLEKQYSDALEKYFKFYKIPYLRENNIEHKFSLGEIGRNRVDFLVFDKILIEVKAKNLYSQQDYYQSMRYLKATELKLLLLVNFRSKYINPKRILNSQARIGTTYNKQNLF